MAILDGKGTSQSILESLKNEVSELNKQQKRPPHLAAILVGNDGASVTYVNAKVKACEKIGFESTLIRLNDDITQAELEKEINSLNENPAIDGFIVQVPLPKHLNEQKVVETIKPEKDVDGFHPVNMGKMVLDIPALLPATPKGIMLLLEKNGIATEGKNAVVLGRSHTVGTPVSILLSRKNKNATVTICHSRTKNLKSIAKAADILVVALGRPEFVTGDMVKDGAIVVDVGIHRVADATRKSGYRLKGDVVFDEVAPKASFITPVPGGVGPMTIAGLLANTLEAYKTNLK